MTWIELGETASTNSHLAGIAADAPHGTVVITHRQTAGRGQRGNTWEAEPGKNITMSLLLKGLQLPPHRQFEISMAVSIAIAGTLAGIIGDKGRVGIKWPNDIYVDDRKICGILIEHAIAGAAIRQTIVGIGLNVNQRVFRSDAPNPVSIFNLTGAETDVNSLAKELSDSILCEIDALNAGKSLSTAYFSRLWRSEGYHPYFDVLRNEAIAARIKEVDSDGTLTLELPSGEVRSYLFKEVKAVLGGVSL